MSADVPHQGIHKRRITFFDTDKAGHIPSHVIAFAEAFLDNEYPIDPIFCLPREIAARLNDRILSAFKDGKLQFIPLDESDVADCNTSNPLLRGCKKWALGQRLAKIHKADHVFYFVLDIIFAGAILDSVQFKRPTEFSGILFRPRLHLAHRTSEGIGETIKRWRQYPYYFGAFLLPPLRFVWTLDPFLPIYTSRYLPNGHKLKFISENKIVGNRSEEVSRLHREGPVRFLMFGLLKKRKGVLVLLRALKLFTNEDWNDMEVILLGELDDDVRVEADHLIRELKPRAGNRLRVDNYYAPVEQIEREVAGCDVMLANYLNHIGSSGIAFTAALAGKPILTQETGLLGELARRYDLGIPVDTTRPTAVLEGMRQLSREVRRNGRFPTEGQRRYLADNAVPFTDQILVDLATR